jgi:hypothetical protein
MNSNTGMGWNAGTRTWLMHYATSRKIAGSITDVIGFLQFT